MGEIRSPRQTPHLDSPPRRPDYGTRSPNSRGECLAVWKVYNIQTGRIVKAGFDSDDQAKDWLERRKDLADDEYDIDEMDEEEEEEFLENEDGEEEDEAPASGDYEPEYA